MARINEPFDVLVVSESTLLGKGKRPDQLKKGQLGIFSLTNGMSLLSADDVAKDTNIKKGEFSLNKVRFGVGLSDGSPLIAGATRESLIDYVSYQKHKEAKELSFTIESKFNFEAFTTYSFSVEFSDQSTYQTIGYNRLRKYFSLSTGDIVESPEHDKAFLSKFINHINSNSGGFLGAGLQVDGKKDAPTYKILLSFKSTFGNGILDAKITLLEGFDKMATVVKKNKAVAAQGTGKLVRELEAASQGYRGNIYRVSTIWGLANDDIKLEAKEDKNYNLVTIGYVNDIQNSGFRGKEPYTVILAIEEGEVSNQLIPELRQATELATLI